MEASIRRKLTCLASLLVILVSCSTGTDRQLQQLYDDATRELLRGELVRARERADQGLAITSRQASPWSWKFRLLHDEIRLIDRQLSQPFPVLDEQVPQTTDYATSPRASCRRRLACSSTLPR